MSSALDQLVNDRFDPQRGQQVEAKPRSDDRRARSMCVLLWLKPIDAGGDGRLKRRRGR